MFIINRLTFTISPKCQSVLVSPPLARCCCCGWWLYGKAHQAAMELRNIKKGAEYCAKKTRVRGKFFKMMKQDNATSGFLWGIKFIWKVWASLYIYSVYREWENARSQSSTAVLAGVWWREEGRNSRRWNTKHNVLPAMHIFILELYISNVISLILFGASPYLQRPGISSLLIKFPCYDCLALN